MKAPVHPQIHQQAVDTSYRKKLSNAEQLTADLLPACPRCNDLLPHGSRWCPECGCRLTVDADDHPLAAA